MEIVQKQYITRGSFLQCLIKTVSYILYYDVFMIAEDNDSCIFASNSPLFSENFRNTFRSLDGLVESCKDLDAYWKYLISIMSLSFIGFIVSIFAVISDCIAPCMEEKYEKPRPRTADI